MIIFLLLVGCLCVYLARSQGVHPQPSAGKNVFFWIAWSVSGLIAAAVGYFFVVGLVDGSVSSFNIVPWIGILLLVAAAMAGSFWLYKVGRPLLAVLPLLVLLLPGMFFAVFNLAFALGGGRIN